MVTTGISALKGSTAASLDQPVKKITRHWLPPRDGTCSGPRKGLYRGFCGPMLAAPMACEGQMDAAACA